MSKIIEIDGNKFDVNDYNERFKFLSFIFNNDQYYILITDSLLMEFSNTDSNNLAQRYIDGKLDYFRMSMEIKAAFKPFVKDLNYNNIFYQYLIENSVSDNVKKQQVSRFLEGLMRVIKHYCDYKIYLLDYYFDNKTLHEELKANKHLANFLPSFIIYQEFKGLYDMLWEQYDTFIDKDKFSYSLYFSNKIPKKEKKPNEFLNKGIENFIRNVKDKTAFLNDLRNSFNSQKGITFKILVELLKDNEVLFIGSREFKKFYDLAKPFFEQDIGSYQSINDKYNHESENDFNYYKEDIDLINKELTPLIEKHKI